MFFIRSLDFEIFCIFSVCFFHIFWILYVIIFGDLRWQVIIWEDADPKKRGKDRHLFLFKDRILVTKMARVEGAGPGAPPQFNNKGVIQVCARCLSRISLE